MKSRVLSKVEGRIRKVDVLRNTYGLGIRETEGVGCNWKACDGVWCGGVGERVLERRERASMRLGRRLMGVRSHLSLGYSRRADLSLSREGPTQAVGAGTRGRSSRAWVEK